MDGIIAYGVGAVLGGLTARSLLNNLLAASLQAANVTAILPQDIPTVNLTEPAHTALSTITATNTETITVPAVSVSIKWRTATSLVPTTITTTESERVTVTETSTATVSQRFTETTTQPTWSTTTVTETSVKPTWKTHTTTATSTTTIERPTTVTKSTEKIATVTTTNTSTHTFISGFKVPVTEWLTSTSVLTETATSTTTKTAFSAVEVPVTSHVTHTETKTYTRTLVPTATVTVFNGRRGSLNNVRTRVHEEGPFSIFGAKTSWQRNIPQLVFFGLLFSILFGCAYLALKWLAGDEDEDEMAGGNGGDDDDNDDDNDEGSGPDSVNDLSAVDPAQPDNEQTQEPDKSCPRNRCTIENCSNYKEFHREEEGFRDVVVAASLSHNGEHPNRQTQWIMGRLRSTFPGITDCITRRELAERIGVSYAADLLELQKRTLKLIPCDKDKCEENHSRLKKNLDDRVQGAAQGMADALMDSEKRFVDTDGFTMRERKLDRFENQFASIVQCTTCKGPSTTKSQPVQKAGRALANPTGQQSSVVSSSTSGVEEKPVPAPVSSPKRVRSPVPKAAQVHIPAPVQVSAGEQKPAPGIQDGPAFAQVPIPGKVVPYTTHRPVVDINPATKVGTEAEHEKAPSASSTSSSDISSTLDDETAPAEVIPTSDCIIYAPPPLSSPSEKVSSVHDPVDADAESDTSSDLLLRWSSTSDHGPESSDLTVSAQPLPETPPTKAPNTDALTNEKLHAGTVVYPPPPSLSRSTSSAVKEDLMNGPKPTDPSILASQGPKTPAADVPNVPKPAPAEEKTESEAIPKSPSQTLSSSEISSLPTQERRPPPPDFERPLTPIQGFAVDLDSTRWPEAFGAGGFRQAGTEAERLWTERFNTGAEPVFSVRSESVSATLEAIANSLQYQLPEVPQFELSDLEQMLSSEQYQGVIAARDQVTTGIFLDAENIADVIFLFGLRLDPNLRLSLGVVERQNSQPANPFTITPTAQSAPASADSYIWLFRVEDDSAVDGVAWHGIRSQVPTMDGAGAGDAEFGPGPIHDSETQPGPSPGDQSVQMSQTQAGSDTVSGTMPANTTQGMSASSFNAGVASGPLGGTRVPITDRPVLMHHEAMPLFLSQFPGGEYNILQASTEDFLCAVDAARLSLAAQVPELPRATPEDLLQIFNSPDYRVVRNAGRDSNSNFLRDEQIADVIFLYGLRHGLHLGTGFVCQRDDIPDGPERFELSIIAPTPQQPSNLPQRLVWLLNEVNVLPDDVQIPQKFQDRVSVLFAPGGRNGTVRGYLAHFSGLAPIIPGDTEVPTSLAVVPNSHDSALATGLTGVHPTEQVQIQQALEQSLQEQRLAEAKLKALKAVRGTQGTQNANPSLNAASAHQMEDHAMDIEKDLSKEGNEPGRVTADSVAQYNSERAPPSGQDTFSTPEVPAQENYVGTEDPNDRSMVEAPEIEEQSTTTPAPPEKHTAPNASSGTAPGTMPATGFHSSNIRSRIPMFYGKIDAKPSSPQGLQSQPGLLSSLNQKPPTSHVPIAVDASFSHSERSETATEGNDQGTAMDGMNDVSDKGIDHSPRDDTMDVGPVSPPSVKRSDRMEQQPPRDTNVRVDPSIGRPSKVISAKEAMRFVRGVNIAHNQKAEQAQPPVAPSEEKPVYVSKYVPTVPPRDVVAPPVTTYQPTVPRAPVHPYLKQQPQPQPPKSAISSFLGSGFGHDEGDSDSESSESDKSTKFTSAPVPVSDSDPCAVDAIDWKTLCTIQSKRDARNAIETQQNLEAACRIMIAQAQDAESDIVLNRLQSRMDDFQYNSEADNWDWQADARDLESLDRRLRHLYVQLKLKEGIFQCNYALKKGGLLEEEREDYESYRGRFLGIAGDDSADWLENIRDLETAVSKAEEQELLKYIRMGQDSCWKSFQEAERAFDDLDERVSARHMEEFQSTVPGEDSVISDLVDEDDDAMAGTAPDNQAMKTDEDEDMAGSMSNRESPKAPKDDDMSGTSSQNQLAESFSKPVENTPVKPPSKATKSRYLSVQPPGPIYSEMEDELFSWEDPEETEAPQQKPVRQDTAMSEKEAAKKKYLAKEAAKAKLRDEEIEATAKAAKLLIEQAEQAAELNRRQAEEFQRQFQ